METRIPPVVVMLLIAAVMWLLQLSTTPLDIALLYRVLMALIVFALGIFFCAAGVISFRRHKTTVNPLAPSDASSLVTTGIYQISRNPMYVGFALFLVAFAIILGSFWSFIGVAGFVLYMNRFQIEPEERALSQLFGEEFEHYTKGVRRWI